MKEKKILKLKEGTLVRIKSNVKCGECFKKPCRLTFRNKSKKKCSCGYKYGISTINEDVNGSCYDFHASDYELVDNYVSEEIKVNEPELVDTTDYKIKYFEACIEIEKLKQELISTKINNLGVLHNK